MATTTPNFGWPVPTSTDLVKDGATAIEALGDGIDTSMVDLKGGTTGQILAKATSADMDFAWITNDVGDITAVTAGTGISGGGSSGAVTITNSMATEIAAKGDLIVGTGSATFDNLTAGANGESLVADSSTSTGLRYQAPVQANPIINSNFSVWQRGTSFVGSTGNYPFTADRWQMFANQDERVSRQVTGDTTNLPFIQYCGRVGRVASSTSTTAIALDQPLETVNSIFYAGKTVTFSFYARRGANYSSTSNILNVQLIGGTGTDQSLSTGFTGQTNIIDQTATLTTTWQRFTFTAAIAATFTQLAIRSYYVPTGTAGASDFYEVTGFQLEVGSVATPYKPNGATFQSELAACMRYYEKTYIQGVAPATSTSEGVFIHYGCADGGSTSVVTVPMQVAKRNVSYAVSLYTTTGTSNTWSYGRSGVASTATPTVDLKSERTFRAYLTTGANWVVTTVTGHWVVDNEL